MGTEQYILTKDDFAKLKNLRESAGHIRRCIEFKNSHPNDERVKSREAFELDVLELIDQIKNL